MNQVSSDTETGFKRHTFTQSIALHLLPGILCGAACSLIAQPIRNLGWPSIAALILAFAFVLTPFEVLYLLRQAKKDGKSSLDGLILYRERLPFLQYLIWVPAVVIMSGLVVAVLQPITEKTAGLFAWLPEALRLDLGLSDEYSTQVLSITYVLFFIQGAIIGPIVEEYYFRGYLLPRMPSSLKGYAPLLHSALMALYHTWTPWLVIARTVGLLPLVYVVQRKKNIYVGMIAHCLLNTIDVATGVIFILNRF